MPNGSKCSAPALRDKPYCYFHTRLHVFAARPPLTPYESLKLPVLEDRSAIQVALAQVPITAVHSVTLTPAGDELGPETRTCPYPFKCATCDVQENCEEYEPEEDDEEEDVEEG